jgi:hypothetical protein
MIAALGPFSRWRITASLSQLIYYHELVCRALSCKIFLFDLGIFLRDFKCLFFRINGCLRL